MVTALVLMNVERVAVNTTAQQLLTIPGVSEVYSVTGEYDLVCNGHEHHAVIERVRNVKGSETLRIDPGTVAGVSAPATYAFGDLRSLEFSIRPVPS